LSTIKTTLSLTLFSMNDILLLLHGLMKVLLVAGVMVLVVTAPSRADAPVRGQLAVATQATDNDQNDDASWGRRMLHTDDDRWLEADDASPSMNLDGTPMAGDLDTNGNFYGDCSTSSMWDD
jgi:hypothetical protein